MALQPTKTSSFGFIPCWAHVEETLPGGFKLVVIGLNTADVLLPGTPMLINETNRTATVSKTCTMYAASSTTVLQVKKNHQFQVGDNLAKTIGGASYAITVIDKSNALYDSITVGTALGSLSVGDVLFQSSATGAAAGAYSNLANFLTLQSVPTNTDEPVTVVAQGTVYARRTIGLTSDIIANCKQIVITQSV